MQARSDHSCFDAYIKRFPKKYTHFVGGRWGVAREAVFRAVSSEFSPNTMVALMLQSEESWKHIESFITQG